MNLDIIKELSILAFIVGFGILAGATLCIGNLVTNKLKISTKFFAEGIVGGALCLIFWLALYWLDDGKIMFVYVLLAVFFTRVALRVCKITANKLIAKRKLRQKAK